ncbi:ABC transporter ATP-binding protein [Clostridium sp. SYSU_GA19001]|uniref:ABC transporter ATP-binding protein n=1 Tax=Clostridium caldaquaticum TaxID=2940653 RepID=UPI002076E39E|nr:ABC transporter ATP-binding protein [Clostridium caldaquaticum]MCM8710083.1 ABC transporter ATP-binding protein [Clostridium caldaquaticum]
MNEYINVINLSFSYEEKEILKHINLNFNKGRFYSVIGPNGSGKSTFIKNLSKIIQPKHKSIFIDKKDIISFNNKNLAKMISVIPQDISIDYEFTVLDIVMMGRSPYKKRFEDFNMDDEKTAEKYMKLTNTWQLKDKLITQLSGGEVQRVIAARALSQETDIILLDEPTSHLDIQYQIEFLNIFKSLKNNKVIIAVLHDLNLASIFSDEIVLINKGQVKAFGKPWDVINKENIKDVYNLSVEVFENPISKCPYVIPVV